MRTGFIHVVNTSPDTLRGLMAIRFRTSAFLVAGLCLLLAGTSSARRIVPTARERLEHAGINPDDLDAVLEAAQIHENFNVRLYAVRFLSEDANQDLAPYLEDSHVAVRIGTAEILAKRGDEKAHEAMVREYETLVSGGPDKGVGAFARIGATDPTAYWRLSNALKITAVLAAYDDFRGLELARFGALQSPNSNHQCRAARALVAMLSEDGPDTELLPEEKSAADILLEYGNREKEYIDSQYLVGILQKAEGHQATELLATIPPREMTPEERKQMDEMIETITSGPILRSATPD